MTHDYKRHGTTSLFAALNIRDGTIISTCQPRHRHQEWIKFLKLIKASVPPDKEVHLICDNYATHKHPKVKAWAKRNPRFHFHFTPTSASWLNMIERFFRDLSEKALKRGSFYNVNDLTGAIGEYINAHNDHPKPFIWTASAKDILAKVKRARAGDEYVIDRLAGYTSAASCLNIRGYRQHVPMMGRYHLSNTEVYHGSGTNDGEVSGEVDGGRTV